MIIQKNKRNLSQYINIRKKDYFEDNMISYSYNLRKLRNLNYNDELYRDKIKHVAEADKKQQKQFVLN